MLLGPRRASVLYKRYGFSVGGSGNQRVTAITIDAAQVSDTGAANYTNFPVLITHDTLITSASEALNADGSFPMQTDGGDLLFYSDAGLTTRIACEVVSVSLDNDPNNSTLEVWVLVPTVDYDDDTVIYMTYASTSGTETQPAVDAAYGRNAVWADFKAVWHLNGTTDSTGNGHTLTATGSPSVVAASWGQGYDLDGSTQHLAFDYTPGSVYPLTLSVFASNDDVATNQNTLSINDTGTTTNRVVLGFGGAITDDPVYALSNVSSSQFSVSGSGYTASGFYYASGVFSGQASRTGYLAGVGGTANSIDQGGAPTGIDGGAIGTVRGSTIETRHNGIIEEARIIEAALTAGWMQTESAMMNAPATFAAAAAPSST